MNPKTNKKARGGEDAMEKPSAGPKKKKSKMREEDEGNTPTRELGSFDFTSLQGVSVAFGYLLEETKTLKRRISDVSRENMALKETVRLQGEAIDIFRRMLGVSGELMHEKADRTPVLVQFDPDFVPARTIEEVKFVTDDGQPRYPGMNVRQTGPSGGVYMGKFQATPQTVLSVPYYTAMEQLQRNTALLERLNNSVLPVLNNDRIMVSALRKRFFPDEPYDPGSLQTEFSKQLDITFFPAPVPRTPNLVLWERADQRTQEGPPVNYEKAYGLMKQQVLKETSDDVDAQRKARTQDVERTEKILAKHATDVAEYPDDIRATADAIEISVPEELVGRLEVLERQVKRLSSEQEEGDNGNGKDEAEKLLFGQRVKVK